MTDDFGFLNLNKSAGWTSHDCVAKVRRLLKMKKVGHGGTLDPAATGVLPIALGKATRLLQFLPGEKAYLARIRFGLQTTTDDLEGSTIASQNASHLTLEQVKSALPRFLGRIEQTPPAYSAIQRDGKRMYEMARAGKEVDVPARIVDVSRIEAIGWHAGEFPEVEVEIACGGGTYIRAIARDLGEMLGVGGTLAALTRTQSCGLTLEDSLTLEALAAQLQAGTFQPTSPDALLGHLPAATLPAETAQRWCQGQRVLSPDAIAPSASVLRIYREDGHFLGISELANWHDRLQLTPKIVLFP